MLKGKNNIDDKRFSFFSRKKTQVILGFIFAFMAVLLLTVGIVRIWTWFNANFAHRELAYQRSRLTAGKPQEYVDTGMPVMFERYPDSRTKSSWMDWVKTQTVIDIGGEDIGLATGDPTKKYKPINLTEEWVFEGIVREGVSLYGTAGMTLEEMVKQCEEECASDSDCITSYLGDTVFDRTCPCFTKCFCLLQAAAQANFQISQAEKLELQASRIRASASSMRDSAEDCDDPWELCWWGDWDATPNELKNAAAELDAMALVMDLDAATMRAKAAAMLACCNLETHALQQACIEGSVKEAGCDSYCFLECSNQCNYFSGRGGRYEPCHSGCDAHCYNICTEAAGSDCQDLVNNQVNSINSLIAGLEAEKQKIQSGIASLQAKISECESWSHTYCDDKCYDEARRGGNYQNCYDECYPLQRQDCCQSVCCLESGNQINCHHSLGRLDPTCDEALQKNCTDSANETCTEEGEFRDEICFGEEFAVCYNEETVQSCYDIEPFNVDSWMSEVGFFSLGSPCSAYERDCYEPTSFCDEDCYGQTNCPRCGLQEIEKRLEDRIAEIDAEIADLNQRIEDLGNCCSVTYALLENQMNCIKGIMTRE